MTDKSLKCPDCGTRFSFAEAEQHEATMEHLTIGCPACSSPLTYHRSEGGY